MSRPMRSNPEGYSTRPSEAAWGCVPTEAAWVPFPKKIPRRHPLIDTVGRIDDPCERPKYDPPDFRPKPSFIPPQEGYPNDLCITGNGKGKQQGSLTDEYLVPEGSAVIDMARGTGQEFRLRLPAVSNESWPRESPSLDECCDKTRSLDIVKQKYQDIVGPLEEREAGQFAKYTKCQTICQPLIPKYPCRGVIDDLPDTGWKPEMAQEQCTPPSLRSDSGVVDWKEQKPVTGWEFIDKCRTCDYYPIQKDLPKRFNHPAWFKGYGCETPVHPFYVTIAQDYGRFGPNPHTMTQMYYPKSTSFTEMIGITGKYRNRALNTSCHKSCTH